MNKYLIPYQFLLKVVNANKIKITFAKSGKMPIALETIQRQLQ